MSTSHDEYGYIWQHLHAGILAFALGEGTTRRRLSLAISSGIGLLKSPITSIPEAIAPRLDKLHTAIDRVVEIGPDAVDEIEVRRVIEDWIDLYTWVCHMRGPDRA